MIKKIKSIFISDVHIGMSFSNLNLLYNTLEKYNFENIYLVGDTLDTWMPNYKKNIKIFEQFLHYLLKKECNIYITPGNHDAYLENFKILKNKKIHIQKFFYYTINNKKFLITHGDIFDEFKNIYLSKIGHYIYNSLFYINKLTHLKISFYSKIYAKKFFVLPKFKQNIYNYLVKNNIDGIICGHIHYPEKIKINNKLYINCGDWLDSNSYIIDDNNELKLIFKNHISS